MFVLVYSLRVQSIMGREGMVAGCEVAGCIALAVRKHRGMNTGPQFMFSIYSVRDPTLGMVPLFRVCVPSKLSLFETTSEFG